jgi:hypothetical protein
VRKRWVIAAGLLLVGVVAVAVVRLLAGGDDGTAAGPPPAYDPPSRFDTGRGTALPRDADATPLPAVLRGFDAFLALPDGLQVLDTRDGSVRATLAPAAAAVGDSAVPPGIGAGGDQPAASASVQLTGTPPGPPISATVAGRPAVVAAYPVQVAGHGTTLGHEAVQVLALDADSLATLASPRIDLPVSLQATDQLRTVRPVATSGGLLVVVVELGVDHVPATYALDLATGRVVWQLPGFAAGALAGASVIGIQGDGSAGFGVAAVGVVDGARRWVAAGAAARSATVWPAGPALVAAQTTDPGTGARTLVLLDPVTGSVRASQPGQGELTCRFDEARTVVCYQGESGQTWAAGFDAATGQRLWQLPDAAAGRVAPRVSTAWHGVVYGSTDAGTVALDARSGADRQVDPGLAPDLVNAYVGLTAATLADPRPAAHLAVS